MMRSHPTAALSRPRRCGVQLEHVNSQPTWPPLLKVHFVFLKDHMTEYSTNSMKYYYYYSASQQENTRTRLAQPAALVSKFNPAPTSGGEGCGYLSQKSALLKRFTRRWFTLDATADALLVAPSKTYVFFVCRMTEYSTYLITLITEYIFRRKVLRRASCSAAR